MKTIETMDALDSAALMAIYAEGNRENGAWFFPELSPEEQVKKAESEFLKYLREDFFTVPGNRYCVLETEEGEWAAALRISEKGEYLWLEALETRPDLRRRGYGKAILREVLSETRREIRDQVSRKNQPSLRTHFAAGFTILEDPARDPDTGEIVERCVTMSGKTI